MDLWYERLELAEEHHKDMLRGTRNWELLQGALKSTNNFVHPAAQLFNQINQHTKQIRLYEAEESRKEERHVDQLV